METGESDELENLLSKHRQERKELQSKITALKKTIPKNDKKKKKDLTDQIATLENELTQRQKAELETFKKPENQETHDDVQENKTTESIPQNNIKVTRAQRRRNKKESENQDRDLRIIEQEKLNKQGPRTVELNSITKTLKEENLLLYNIPADGNCLYCAIKHQLETTGREPLEVNDLRHRTADFIRKNKDDFLPFMCNEDDDIVSEEQFENYCNDVANTKLWGGQLELRALSNILKCPIKIIQAIGPPTLQGEQFSGKPLILTYHRHLYRLGEHYNSTIELNN